MFFFLESVKWKVPNVVFPYQDIFVFDKLNSILLVEFECIELGQLFFSCFSWNGLHKINCEHINCFKHLLIIFHQQFHVTVIYFRCRGHSSVRTSTNCTVRYNFHLFHLLGRSCWERRGKRLRFSALMYPQANFLLVSVHLEDSQRKPLLSTTIF